MLRFLLEKEFKQIMRNRFLPRMIFVFPIMVLLIFPLAANFEVKHIRLSVVDYDHHMLSRRLIQDLSGTSYFQLTGIYQDYVQGLRSVELNASDICLVIPSQFEAYFISGHSPHVFIAADTVNGTKGGLGSFYLTRAISLFGQRVYCDYFSDFGQSQSGIAVIPRFLFNPFLEYPIFMVPALMVMLLSMICGFLPALNIIYEKESGTLDQINVTPVPRFLFVISKLIPYWIIGFIVLSISFVIARFFYGLVCIGHLWIIYLFAFVFVLAFSGFGLVISNFAKSMQQAMFMMFFFVITFIFLSGLYTPVANMPGWAQMISTFSPLKYFIYVMRMVYLKGSSFWDMRNAFIALFCFAVFFNLMAVFTYHKRE